MDVKSLPREIQSKVYRPKEHEMLNKVEIEFDNHGHPVPPKPVEPEHIQVDVELDE